MGPCDVVDIDIQGVLVHRMAAIVMGFGWVACACRDTDQIALVVRIGEAVNTPFPAGSFCHSGSHNVAVLHNVVGLVEDHRDSEFPNSLGKPLLADTAVVTAGAERVLLLFLRDNTGKCNAGMRRADMAW